MNQKNINKENEIIKKSQTNSGAEEYKLQLKFN